MDILIRGLKERLTEADEQTVPSLTPSADIDDDAAIKDTARGDRDRTPSLRLPQEPTRGSRGQSPLHHVARGAVSGEERAIATAGQRNKGAAKPRSPSDSPPVPDGVQLLARPKQPICLNRARRCRYRGGWLYVDHCSAKEYYYYYSPKSSLGSPRQCCHSYSRT
jgi:hypothetical protein